MDAGGAAKRLQSKVTSANQSPERSKRKDKWATERQELPVVETEEGTTHRRRLQDPVALEDDTAANPRPAKRGRRDGSDAPERAANPEYVPRSGHFYEHDDRSNWRPRPNRRPFDSKMMRRSEDRWNGGQDDSEPDRWRHDRFLQLEKGLPPRNRGRNSENSGKFSDRWVGGRRPVGNSRVSRGGFSDRGRWGDSAVTRRAFAAAAPAARVPSRPFSRGPPEDQWKHDLFDDALDYPAAKREEDSVARAEALLAA